MYAPSVPTVSHPAPAAGHSPAELAFLDADHLTGIVAFAAPSRHDATRVNVVSLDTTNGDIHCTCKAGECGRLCWHARVVAAAWLASAAMLAVRWLTDAQLARYGAKHAAMVRIYAARTGRFLPADALALVAARHEWRRRIAARATRHGRPALSVLAYVA